MTDAPDLAVVVSVIAELLNAPPGADDFAPLFLSSERRVRRMGFALEPDPGLAEWAHSQRLDALFLHRPWRLGMDALGDMGVVAFHHAFDATLAVGYNVRLATALGLHEIVPMGENEGLPLGMIGDAEPQTWGDFAASAQREFTGIERVVRPIQPQVRRVAVVGAMNDLLVHEAFEVGADVYLTGQMRVPGREAVRETGIGVIAVGHARGERWGLRTLADLLRARFPDLYTVLRSAPEAGR